MVGPLRWALVEVTGAGGVVGDGCRTVPLSIKATEVVQVVG